MSNKKEISAVKKKIEQYYYSEKIIAWNKKELQRLTERLEQMEKERKSPFLPVPLNTDLKGISYDGVASKGGGLPQSPMERNIESIYSSLDRAYEQTQQKILELKIKIPQQEDEQKQMEFYIHLLNEENQKLLKYKYEYKKSVTQIAFLLHLSKSTVCRSFCDIYLWLYKMMEYDGVIKKT